MFETVSLRTSCTDSLKPSYESMWTNPLFLEKLFFLSKVTSWLPNLPNIKHLLVNRIVHVDKNIFEIIFMGKESTQPFKLLIALGKNEDAFKQAVSTHSDESLLSLIDDVTSLREKAELEIKQVFAKKEIKEVPDSIVKALTHLTNASSKPMTREWWEQCIKYYEEKTHHQYIKRDCNLLSVSSVYLMEQKKYESVKRLSKLFAKHHPEEIGQVKGYYTWAKMEVLNGNYLHARNIFQVGCHKSCFGVQTNEIAQMTDKFNQRIAECDAQLKKMHLPKTPSLISVRPVQIKRYSPPNTNISIKTDESSSPRLVL